MISQNVSKLPQAFATGFQVVSCGKISFLFQIEGSADDEKVAHDVKYSFERLIKGLSADKGWSRPGFCLGLTAILSEVPEIDTAEVIEFMRTTLADKTDPDNFKGLALGRCFCMAAIIKSGRATGEHRLEVLNQLFKILIKRPYLRQLVCQVIVEFIERAENLDNDDLQYVSLLACQTLCEIL